MVDEIKIIGLGIILAIVIRVIIAVYSVIEKKRLKTEIYEFIKSCNEDEFSKLKSNKKCFRLLLQLMNDFKLGWDETYPEIKVYKNDEMDSNEIALYRFLKDSGLPMSMEGVIEVFNHLVVAGHGVEIDWRYDDADFLFALNNTKVFKELGIKIGCSKHEWNEEFEIFIEIDKNEPYRFLFSYSSIDYHKATELVERVNQKLENVGVIIQNCDDGSDSFRFIPMMCKDLKVLKDIYGKYLTKILMPISK